MTRLVCIMFAATTACSAEAERPAERQPKTVFRDEDYSYTPKPERMYPEITDASAPTVGDLKARGLKQSGWDAEMFACGPACDAVYAYAIFFGHQRKYPTPSEHLFTCPNPGKPMEQDQWRCTAFTGSKGQA